MQEKKNNALIQCKKSDNGFNHLVMTLTLDNGEVVKCEITLNPYNKKGLGKLYYKVANNVQEVSKDK